MRNTKIVCTIGPASESVEKLEQLIDAGMNVARLNFSHGDFDEHGARIKNIREAAARKNKTVAILLDTKGPEIRTGNFKEGRADIVQGNEVIVSMNDVEGTAERFSITYDGLINDVHPGSKILLDDGLIELEVKEIKQESGEIVTVALNSGEIKNKKGVNVPNVSVNLPGITEKDTNDIIFGVEQGVDFIAASFVRRPSDVLEIKEVLEQHQAEHIKIIPKIENQEGVDNINSILEVSDGLMVARGDLGVEIPAEDVPLVQKKLITQCNTAGKPVITATQMLDSMQRNPRPTRAEASDVANAIFDGTDAIMLSGETAAGNYPVESVQTMSNIALKAESALNHKVILEERSKNVDMEIREAITQSVSHTAYNLGIGTIITPTESGSTARMVSKYRPKATIIAVTVDEVVNRQLSLVWGVHAVMGTPTKSTDEMLEVSVKQGLEAGVCKRGETVLVVAGVPAGEKGTTNLMKVHVIGDVVAKGQGIGRSKAYGHVVFAKNNEEALTRMNEGDILVTHATEKEMMPAIEKAAAVITEEGGLTSHAAVVGVSLGIPVIVGVENVFDLLEDGQDITVDSSRGQVYAGHAGVL
ncbi:pyruvate kinase [Oceanobacillus oncorhynchi subsp. incaldanensis]|uniref:Pyruvate kinase n=1 Tax=Oceanobacillus aidingensis TaxID=645964 RepID=A0ABV9K1Y0_9BACI|nr:pyruvate kinase [Oceanobacillus oncorhynchi]GIO18188.1 pyruvate kinase [Oceanobacillus oncorhynchi subsp. incaldanensis]